MELFLEHVRVFNRPLWTRIAPLTFLVGENSTGKTTFLAMLHAANGRAIQSFKPQFNIPPFDLGSFDTVATHRGGRGGRAEYFSIGKRFPCPDSDDVIEIKATYQSSDGQPSLARLNAAKGKLRLSAVVAQEKVELRFHTLPPGKPPRSLLTTTAAMPTKSPAFAVSINDFLLHAFVRAVDKRLEGQSRVDIGRSVERLFDFIQDMAHIHTRTIALSPVRTKPQRTYDEIRDDFRPEGDHIPVILARLRREGSNHTDRVFDFIRKYGRESGLLSDLRVKTLGLRPTDPFQLLIKGEKGPASNLVDVGYGVSQALPIVVEALTAPRGSMLLMQQPEVHLHPRAQAAVGSALVHLVRPPGLQFVVETHSDYIVDRVRQHVAAGDIQPSDVQILFFDKSGLDVVVRPISVDNVGNLVKPPARFRAFFMEEEMRLLSRQ